MPKTYQQGFFRPRNPQKYKGDPRNIVYRSSWELKLMLELDRNQHVIQWGSEEVVIPYISPIDGQRHRYFIDFYVKSRQTDGTILEEIIEVKPHKQTLPPKRPKSGMSRKYVEEAMTYVVNEAKWKAAEAYAAKRGWRFRKATERDLFG